MPCKVALYNPKVVVNLAGAVRACSCFNIESLAWTGNRIRFPAGQRIPREFRLYKEVQITHQYQLITQEDLDIYTPVAVEYRKNSENLRDFVHPENALYVLGPEDNSVPNHILSLCHRFVYIDTTSCLNLAMTVGVVLYDRYCKERF